MNGYGMTAFTQAALMELDRMESVKRKPPRKFGEIDHIPDIVKKLLARESPSDSTPKKQGLSRRPPARLPGLSPTSPKSEHSATSPYLEKAKAGAIALTRKYSKTPPPGAVAKEAQQDDDEENRRSLPLVGTNTAHHKHHLVQKQKKILELEKERVLAAQQAKAEQLRQERVREKRLDKMFQTKMQTLQHIERDLEAERAQLRQEHRDLESKRPPVSAIRLPPLAENPLDLATGSDVAPYPESQIRAVFEREGLREPTEHELVTLREGCVMSGPGSNPRTILLRSKRTGELLEVPRQAVYVKHQTECFSSPCVMTAHGEYLLLNGLNVTMEVLGDIAYVTHRSDWNFSIQHSEFGEQLALIIPQSPTQVVSAIAVDIGESKIRSGVIRDAAGDNLIRISGTRRENRLKKLAGFLTTVDAGNRTPATASVNPADRSIAGAKPNQIQSSDDEDEDSIDEEALAAEDGVWVDVMDVNRSSCTGLAHCLLIPLKEARRSDPIHVEVRYCVSAQFVASGDSAVMRFAAPCAVPEPSMPTKFKLDEVSNFQAVICGFAQKGARLETYPPTKLQKCTSMTGTRPNYTIAPKSGVWGNADCTALFAPDRTEEINIQCFTEASPGAINCDAFVVMMTPLAPLNFDLTFKRSVVFVVDSAMVQGEIVSTFAAFCGSLLPSDLLSVTYFHRESLRFFQLAGPQTEKGVFSPLEVSALHVPLGNLLLLFLKQVKELTVRTDDELTRINGALDDPRENSFESSFLGSMERSTMDPSVEGKSQSRDPLLVTQSEAPSSYQLPIRTSFVTDFGKAVALCFDAQAVLAQKRDRRLVDGVREIILLGCTELTPSECLTIGNAKLSSGAGVRFHTAFCGTQYSPTSAFLRGLSLRSRGRAVSCWYPPSRSKELASFMCQLGRPLVLDVEVAFPHTTHTEFAQGIPDLCAGIPLILPGHYRYSGTDTQSEHVAISGRFPKGRWLRRRLLNIKLGLPISKMIHEKFLQAEVSTRAIDLFAPSILNPSSTDRAVAYSQLFNEGCKFSIPLADVFDSRSSGADLPVASQDDDHHVGACSMVVYQLQHTAVDPSPSVFPPVVGTPAPGLIPNGATWAEASFKKIDNSMVETGCVALVRPWRTKDGAAADGTLVPKSVAFLNWLKQRTHTYDAATFALVDTESGQRDVVEQEEWRDYLTHLEAFHEFRISILLQAVQVTSQMSQVEEDHRKTFLNIVEEEKTEWNTFLDSTAELRSIMEKVNISCHEARKRLGYEEEDARALILEHQKTLWTLAFNLATGVQAPVPVSHVEFTLEVCKRWIHDVPTCEFIASMLSVWTSPPKKAEVIGLNGGILQIKSLLQIHGGNERIVDSLLVCVGNFAGVRTNHGKLETSNIVIEVMHALSRHTVSVDVQYRGVRCLAVLASLTQDFRQSIITSSNGLSFVLSNFSRYLSNLRYTTSVFQFFHTVAKETTSHRLLVQLALKTMCSAVLVIHHNVPALKCQFFQIVSQLASSRTLRVELAALGAPTCVLVSVFQQPERVSTAALAAAADCAEKMCGNLGDYPAVTLSFSLCSPITHFLRCSDELNVPGHVIEQAHRLLSRLTLCLNQNGASSLSEVSCDETIRPLFKPWPSIKLLEIVDQSSVQQKLEDSRGRSGAATGGVANLLSIEGCLNTLYGAVVKGEMDCGGIRRNVLIRLFARSDLAPLIEHSRQERETTEYYVEGNDGERQPVLEHNAGPSDGEEFEEVEEAYYDFTLSLHLQDVLSNAFVSHPAQIMCLGFTNFEDFHGTIFEVPASPSGVQGPEGGLGPSLRQFLTQCKAKNIRVPFGYLFDIAFTLLDLAAFYAASKSPHRGFSIDSVWVVDCWDSGIEVICGPSVPVTVDLMSRYPPYTTKQTIFDQSKLRILAKQSLLDDLLDIKQALFEVMCYGQPPESEVSIAELTLPESITSIMFMTEEGANELEASTGCYMPLLDAAELRNFIATWRQSEEGRPWNMVLM